MDNPRCHLCQGTGFANGKICVCITGELPDKLPPELKDIFGDIFSATNDANDGKRSGKG